MNETKKNKELEDYMVREVFRAIVAALMVVCIGVAIIPGVLAYIYGWAWLLVYPVALIVFIILAPKKNR